MAVKKKKAKKAAKKTKAVKKSQSKKAAKKPAKKAKKRVKAAARKAPAKKARKASAKKKIIGEGDYQASRAFLKDQSGFVAKNKAKIPAMGKAAEAALDGPQGDALRDAEATAAARSRDTF
jgi:hypothetical protein